MFVDRQAEPAFLNAILERRLHSGSSVAWQLLPPGKKKPGEPLSRQKRGSFLPGELPGEPGGSSNIRRREILTGRRQLSLTHR